MNSVFRLEWVGRRERPFVFFGLLYGVGLLLTLGIAAAGGLGIMEPRDWLIWFAGLWAGAVCSALCVRASSDARAKYIICAVGLYLCGLFVAGWPEFTALFSAIPPKEWLFAVIAADGVSYVPPIVGCLGIGWSVWAWRRGDEAFRRPPISPLGNAVFLDMKSAMRALPASGGIVIGEAYVPAKERRGYENFVPGRRETWGSGGTHPLLCYDQEVGSTHVLVFAGSGAGKTTSIVIPTALKYPGSMVIYDPAREIGDIVSTYRGTVKTPGNSKRRVIVIDPSMNRVAGCDILELLRTSDNQISDIGAYAMMLLAEKPKATSGGDAFFESTTKALMSGLLMYTLHGARRDIDPKHKGPPTLRQLRCLTSKPEKELKKLISDINANFDDSSAVGFIARPEARRYVKEMLGAFVSMADQTWTGVCATVNMDTQWLSTDKYAAAVCGNDFSLLDLPAGSLDVYLQFAPDVVKANGGVVRALLGGMMRVMQTEERPKGMPPVLFVLDEVDALGYMSILEESRDRGRKYGISLILFYQSIGQLQKHFGKEGATSWFATAALSVFAAITDTETLDLVSKVSGECTVEVDGSSQSTSWRDGFASKAASQNARVTSSINLQKRPLILPHEVREMRGDEQIVIMVGLPAIRCGRAMFFRRPEMLAIAGKSRVRDGGGGSDKKKLLEKVETAQVAEAADQLRAHQGFLAQIASERAASQALANSDNVPVEVVPEVPADVAALVQAVGEGELGMGISRG
jgi:type IV secretion system protein VirD4